jgi:hypothetical protein
VNIPRRGTWRASKWRSYDIPIARTVSLPPDEAECANYCFDSASKNFQWTASELSLIQSSETEPQFSPTFFNPNHESDVKVKNRLGQWNETINSTTPWSVIVGAWPIWLTSNGRGYEWWFGKDKYPSALENTRPPSSDSPVPSEHKVRALRSVPS